MTQLERFTALLDEMNVHYFVEPVIYDCTDIGRIVFVSVRAEGYVNSSDGEGTAVMFNEAGTCTDWS